MATRTCIQQSSRRCPASEADPSVVHGQSRSLWSAKGLPRFSSAIAVFPQDELAIDVLANQSLEVDDLVERLASLYLTPRLVPKKKHPVPVSAQPHPTLGDFEGEHGPLLKLESTADGVSMRKLGGRPRALTFWSDGTFGAGSYEGTRYRPVKDSSGRISSLDEIRTSAGVTVTRRLALVTQGNPSAESIAELVGAYHGDEIDTTYDLTVKSGHILLQSLHQPEPEELAAAGPDRWDGISGPLPGLCITIERAGNGRATALLVDYGDVLGLRLNRIHGAGRH